MVRAAWAVLRLSCVLGLGSILGCASVPPHPGPIRRGDYQAVGHYLERRADYEMRRSGVVGLSIAVLDGDSIVYARGFGFADKEAEIPAAAQTVYRVGSVSKSVTAALVMGLAEDGAIDLDAPLERYLPEFSIGSRFPDAGPVTIRSILAHHSGLPNLWRRRKPNGEPLPYNRLAGEMNNAYLVHRPGFVTKYSTLGYNLLGHVVETVARKAFADYAEETLLRPLGMTTASFGPPPAIIRRLTKAYRDGERVESLPLLAGEIPAGGLHASVLDLVRFARLFLGEGTVNGHALLAREAVRAMMTPTVEIPLDLDARMGYGWHLTPPAGLRHAGSIASQGGSTYPFHSFVIMSPENELGIAVCSNSAEAGPVVGFLGVETMRLALQVKAGPPPPAAGESGGEGTTETGVLPKDFAGRYQTTVGIIDVDVGERVEVTLLGRRFRLFRESGRWGSPHYLFLGSSPIEVPELAGLRFSFTQVDSLRVMVLEEPQGPRIRLGERIEPRPTPEVWRARLGNYNLINAPDAQVNFERTPHVRVRFDDGYLVLYLHLAIPDPTRLSWVVFPVTETEAVFAGLGNYLGGETLRMVREDGQERMMFSGYEFERIDRQSGRDRPWLRRR